MARLKPINALKLALGAMLLASNVGAWEIKGVAYESNSEERTAAYGSIKSYRQMQRLKEMGVNTLLYSPAAYQKDMERPELIFDTTLGDGLEKDLATAKRLGFTLVMMPVIEPISTGDEFQLRQPISMRSQEEWRRWFFNYERMIVHFAALAQRFNVDVFVIGSEYDRATRDHDAEWRRVAKDVRAVFRGRITYAARGFEEAQRIHFWEDLDLIGINADFRLSSTNTPLPEELRHAWDGVVAELGVLSKRNADRPVLITELGYYSVDGVSQRPTAVPTANATEDAEEQAHCFHASLGALSTAPWIQGVVAWKYKVSVTPRAKSDIPSDALAVFQDKPAEAVIRSHFSKLPQP